MAGFRLPAETGSHQQRGIEKNADDSVDLYFGPKAPGGPREKLGANGT